MTLIVGYIYNDNVNIIADSAVTLLNPPQSDKITNESYNSFGEIIQLNDEKLITESAQKIYVYDNRIVLTYSGNVYEGSQVLEDIKYELSIFKEKKIFDILNDYFEKRKPISTEYIIAYCENKIPIIYIYKEKGEVLTNNHSFVLLGSGSNEPLLLEPIKIILKQFEGTNLNANIVLIALISAIQCFSLNAMTFSKGVGGFFNGVYSNKDGVNWINDTCTILYSSNFFEKGELFIINKFNRDCVTFITSPKIGKSLYFPALIWTYYNPTEWKDKWLDKLIELNSNCELDFNSFICYDRRIVTFLNRSKDQYKNYMRFKKISDTQMGFDLHSSLMDKLLSFPINPQTGKEDIDGFGIQLNYL